MSHCCGTARLSFLQGVGLEIYSAELERRGRFIVREMRRIAWLLAEGDQKRYFAGMTAGVSSTHYTFTQLAGLIAAAANALSADHGASTVRRPDVADGIFSAALFESYANKIGTIKEYHDGVLPLSSGRRSGPFMNIASF